MVLTTQKVWIFGGDTKLQTKTYTKNISEIVIDWIHEYRFVLIRIVLKLLQSLQLL